MTCPDSKVYGVNMGPTWVLSAPGEPHVGPINLAVRVIISFTLPSSSSTVAPRPQMSEDEFIFMLRKTPKNKWEELCDEYGFNLKHIKKRIEEMEEAERIKIELVRGGVDWLIGWLIDWLIELRGEGGEDQDWTGDSKGLIGWLIDLLIDWIEGRRRGGSRLNWWEQGWIGWLVGWLIDWIEGRRRGGSRLNWWEEGWIDWLVGWLVDGEKEKRVKTELMRGGGGWLVDWLIDWFIVRGQWVPRLNWW